MCIWKHRLNDASHFALAPIFLPKEALLNSRKDSNRVNIL